MLACPAPVQTRVLTHRIAHLIRVHGAQPWQVLAITFTNKVGTPAVLRLLLCCWLVHTQQAVRAAAA